ncbi:MAG: endonuclease/exonuclease/phosphatase family protein [Pseudomonadales bacterium]|nr:endonuclease/exonuclease/phosphatase family protein [Pseudomonadales bacterium]
MLTVMTLNIWNYEGPWEARLPLIRDWISLLDPDVIALQEVLHGAAFDQASQIFDGFDYYRSYAAGMDYWNDTSLRFGNLVASRWPFVSEETIELPLGRESDQRVLLATHIDRPGGLLSFSTTHLSSAPHEGALRERQAQVVAETILRRRTKNGTPSIFCGDFNATPDSAEIRYLKGLQALGGKSAFFTDAWELAGDGSAGLTFTRRNHYLTETLINDRRLDYIFVEALPAGKGRVRGCDLVCHVPRHGIYPSDHFGLTARIDI